MWQKGEGDTQPSRPGPVAIYDIDDDDQTEVICFFYDRQKDPNPYSMAGITIQILDGATREIEQQIQPQKNI